MTATERWRAASVILVLAAGAYSAGAGNLWGAAFCAGLAGWAARDLLANVQARRQVEAVIARQAAVNAAHIEVLGAADKVRTIADEVERYLRQYGGR